MPSFVDRSEDPTGGDVALHGPCVQGVLHPCWNRHGSEMPGFASEIGNDPMLLALLDRLKPQGQQLGAAKAAANQHRNHCVVPQLSNCRWSRGLEKPPPLFGRQPVPQPNADPPHSLDAPNAGCQFRAQETGIGCLIRNTPTAAKRRLIVAGAYARCSRWIR
jgi:hypothetical protein